MSTKVGNIKVRSQNGEVQHLWSYLIDKYVAFSAQRLFWGTMVAETGSVMNVTPQLEKEVLDFSVENPDQEFIITAWNNVNHEITQTVFQAGKQTYSEKSENFVRDSLELVDLNDIRIVR